MYILTFWYRPEERAVRIALIVACATLGGAFGGAIAFAIGRALNGVHGLEAWRWLFLIEGAPSCVAALLCALFFPDYPETARWPSADECALVRRRLADVPASHGSDRITWASTRATLRDWRLYAHYVAFISNSVAFSSISLFAPTIVRGLGFEGLAAQLFTVPPYALAFGVVVGVAWLADRHEARSWAAIGAYSSCGVCFLIQGGHAGNFVQVRV